MTVAEVTAEHSREVSSVTVDLALHTDQPLNALGLDPLRFYLGADDYTAQTLYLWLNHYLSGIELEVAGKSAGCRRRRCSRWASRKRRRCCRIPATPFPVIGSCRNT